MKRLAIYLAIMVGTLSTAAAWADPLDDGPATGAAVKTDEDNGLASGIDKIRALPPELANRLSSKQLEHILTNDATEHDSPVEIFVPLFFFICILGVVGGGLFHSYRKEKQRHETLRLMVERGATIPPELLVPRKRVVSDLRKGILLLGAGAGLIPSLLLLSHTPHAWTLGLLPIFVGLGYLITWKLERREPSA